MGRQPGNERKGFGEAGIKSNALDPVSSCRGEVTLLASKQGDTATTLIVANETGVDCCLTYERVTTIDGVRDSRILFCRGRPTNDERLVVDFLLAHRMGVEHLHSFAIGGTPEGQGGIFKRTASVSIQATAVTDVPIDVSMKFEWGLKSRLTKNLLRTRSAEACRSP